MVIIKEFIVDFLKNHGIESNVLEDENMTSVAHYNVKMDTFSFSAKSITGMAERYRISIEDCTVIIMSHELGHYYDNDIQMLTDRIKKLYQELDYKKNTLMIENEIQKLTKQGENNAWEIGYKFLPEHLKQGYDLFNENNLEATYYLTLIKIERWKFRDERIKLSSDLARFQKMNTELKIENDTLKVKLLSVNK